MAGMFVEASVELLLQRPATRQARALWLHRFCARSMRRMGITISVQGGFPEQGALIANHQTYLDIVTLAAIHPCVFVSKVEILELPVIGWMTKIAGTVLVERGRGRSALEAGSGMKAAFKDGMPVVFFPEGTTSSGPLLPFRSGLLAQVMSTEEPITAAYLRYSMPSDNGADVTVAENICWGALPLFEHAFTFLGLHGVHVDVCFGSAPIAFSSKELHRKAAAVEARAAMAALGERLGVIQQNAINDSTNLHLM